MKPPKPSPPSAVPARKRGKPAHVPTDQARRTVSTMVGVGMAQEDICAVLEIKKPTLHRHYRRELDTSYIKVIVRMRTKLIAKAETGDSLCLIHVNKVLGWNDRLIVVDGNAELDPKTATEAELDAEIARLSKRPAVLRAAKATVH